MGTKEKIELAGLPLAVYREIAAHLRQVSGVEVDLIPQSSQQFDYNQSQIGGLHISWAANSTFESRQRMQQILTYYQNRYSV
jgi:urease accessory protein UreH